MFKYVMLWGANFFLLLAGFANSDPPKETNRPKPVLTLRAHGQVATCVVFSPCGTRLATGGLDQRAALWDATTGKELLTLKGHGEALFASLAFSPDGKRLAAWDQSPALKVWDTASGKPLLTLPALPQPIFAQAAFSPNGLYLASTSLGFSDAGVQPGVRVWDARTGKRVAVVRAVGPLVGFAYAADGKRLATCGGSGSVTVWEMATGAAALSVGQQPKETAVIGVAFNPDGTRLATAGVNGMVRVWALASAAESWARRGHKVVAVRVRFSPDGKLLATAGFNHWLKAGQSRPGQTFQPDGEVIIWSAATGEKLEALRFGKGEAAFDLAWSPDGSRLATAHGDGTVKVWSVKYLLGR